MKTEPIINGKPIKCLTDFRWATVRAYVQSDLNAGRDKGVAAVYGFAALALTESIEQEKRLHADLSLLHEESIIAGCTLNDEEAQQISDYINEKLGLSEAAQVETPEGKP